MPKFAERKGNGVFGKSWMQERILEIMKDRRVVVPGGI